MKAAAHRLTNKPARRHAGFALLRLSLACLATLGVVTSGGEATATTPTRDVHTLPTMLKARGFKPPAKFKALVIPLGRVDGSKRDPSPRRLSYNGTAWDRDDWWPASTVKLYAAIAALETTRRLGMRPRARATFRYPDKARKGRISGLVHMALVPSNNLAFDRLVELVGAQDFNERFLSPRNGLGDTVMLRSYYGRVRLEGTNIGTNRDSPEIVIEDKGVRSTLPARYMRKELPCEEEGNCTTLDNLAEALRRVMLHEKLPASERFALGPRELDVLRRALRHRKKRGNGVVDGLREGFGKGLTVAHKPGYSRKWFSDVVYAFDERSGRAWIVAMAGFPGRHCLDRAAQHVGALLRKLQ